MHNYITITRVAGPAPCVIASPSRGLPIPCTSATTIVGAMQVPYKYPSHTHHTSYRLLRFRARHFNKASQSCAKGYYYIYIYIYNPCNACGAQLRSRCTGCFDSGRTRHFKKASQSCATRSLACKFNGVRKSSFRIRDVFWLGLPAQKVQGPAAKHISNPDVAPFQERFTSGVHLCFRGVRL